MRTISTGNNERLSCGVFENHDGIHKGKMMTEQKHTPGPWYWEGSTAKTINACMWVYPKLDSPYDYRGSICYIQSCEHIEGIASEEAYANAKLVCAAPDLLEFALLFLERNGMDESWMTSKARAAIAKATGEL